MDSVRAQTFQDWELLLVEDGSKDHTAEVITAYLEKTGEHRIRLISMEQNQGAARARNRGVKEARGRYLAYLDADDLWEPEKAEGGLFFLSHRDTIPV